MLLEKTLILGLEPNTYIQKYVGYNSTRSSTVKRVKPVGTEVLFKGTAVSNSKENVLYCRYGDIWGPPPVSPRNWFQGSFRGSITAPTLPSDEARIRAAVKAQKVNVAQFLAEFPSTARMFMDLASRIVRTRRAMLRGRPMDVIDALSGVIPGASKVALKRSLKVPTKALANNQLAFTYGVKPLISDLNGAVSEVLSNTRSRPLIFQIRTGQSASVSSSSIIKNDGAWMISADSVNENFVSVKRSTIVWFEMEKPSWINDVSRLGFLNPAALAWELVPYSFVVDWFINVGEVLQNLDAFVGVKRVGIHRTLTTESRGLTTIVPKGSTGIGGTSTRTLITKQRSYSDTLPPQVSFKWQPHLSFSRILSGLSLSRARFS